MIHAIKAPAFLRPSSRPSSPAPSSRPLLQRNNSDSEFNSTSAIKTPTGNPAGSGAVPRKLSLPLAHFRKASTPVQGAVASAGTPADQARPTNGHVTLVQDGSYLEALSLKFGEAVARALAPSSAGVGSAGEIWDGKKPMPIGRGRALGAIIVGELTATSNSAHLQRAVLRTLQRPLSVLITSLNAQLLPLLSSPDFQPSVPGLPFINAHTRVLQPITQAQANAFAASLNITAAQAHALALAHFCGELLSTLYPDMHSNSMVAANLRPTKDGLNSVIVRVVNPLVGRMKGAIVGILKALENVNPGASGATAIAPAGHAGHGVSSGHATKAALTGTAKAHAVSTQHPAIIALQAIVPVCGRLLGRYIINVPGQTSGQATLAGLLIALVWAGVVGFAHRPLGAPSTNEPAAGRQRAESLPLTAVPASAQANPATTSTAGTLKKLLPGSTTPPGTPGSNRFTLKLPPSRPSSPPGSGVPSLAQEIKLVYDLLDALPKPVGVDDIGSGSGGDGEGDAREAVDEAFAALRALGVLVDVLGLSRPGQLAKTADEVDATLDLKLDALTGDIPDLIALPMLLAWAGIPSGARWIPSVLGISEEEYRERCLTGFGRADACAEVVGRSVVEALRREEGGERLKLRKVIVWLEAYVLETEH